MNIAVLGAGAWGTALAVHAAGAHPVTLWARDLAQAEALAVDRINQRYLPGIALAAGLQLAGGAAHLDNVLEGQSLIIIATPMSGLREMLLAVRHVKVPVAWLCKGFETSKNESFGLLAHEICEQVAPELIAGILSGPSFALEVARGLPTALVAASHHDAVRDALVSAFHSPRLRVYANDDIVGAEVGGAVKNVLAIATGLCDGLGLGLNARAALITRGLTEMGRLGVALGAKAETFTGLSGLGDLVLTATGDLSRNRKVGLALAQGKTLPEIIAGLGHVAEGVYCAKSVVQRAAGLGVDMPISRAVVALLDGQLTAIQAVTALMEREPTLEAG